MANEYTPTVWRTGDVITAEKLNKIEEGIANAESDFSTAEVTIVKTGSGKDSVIGIFFANIGFASPIPTMTGSDVAPYKATDVGIKMFEGQTILDETKFSLVLNTNENVGASIDVGTDKIIGISTNEQPVQYTNIAVSGDATITDYDIEVTGDCTIIITFSSQS